MDALPPELYRPIIQHLDKKTDIARLLRCSRAFQRECEPLLYSEVILNGGTPEQLFYLTRNPRTASLITSLIFTPMRNYSLIHVQVIINRAGFTAPDDDALNRGFLRFALKALTNLKSLKLINLRPIRSPLVGSVFDNVPFKLHTFSCPYAWSEDIVRFLSGQDELRTLEWHESVFRDIIPSHHIPPNILPNLMHVYTTSDVIVHIVPGRPISRVHVKHSQLSVPDLPLLLAQSSKRVEVLVFGFLAIDRGKLGNWKRHLSDLRFLECLIVRKNKSSLYAILPFLTKLTKLILNSMGFPLDISTDESHQLVAKAFEIAPNLRVVEREVERDVVKEPRSEAFLQWIRGEGGPILHTTRDADEWLYY